MEAVSWKLGGAPSTNSGKARFGRRWYLEVLEQLILEATVLTCFAGILISRVLDFRERRKAEDERRIPTQRYTIAFYVFGVILVIWFFASGNTYWLIHRTAP